MKTLISFVSTIFTCFHLRNTKLLTVRNIVLLLVCSLVFVVLLVNLQSTEPERTWISSQENLEIERRCHNRDASEQELKEYEDWLGQKRKLSLYSSSIQRLALLAELMNQKAQKDYAIQTTDTRLWQERAEELLKAERDPKESLTFYKYFEKEINPKVFHWPDVSWTIKPILKYILTKDEQWPFLADIVYSGHLFMKHYGPDRWYNDQPIRWERVQHVSHFLVLERSFGISIKQLKQIVNFGGGTGETELVLRQWGFDGTHFIIDYPPLLIMQRYFLLFSLWPCYLGEDFKALNGRKCILESNELSAFNSHFNKTELSDSLFLATYSLSETSENSRSFFLDNLPISRYGSILLAFQPRWMTVDNVEWMIKFAESLKSRHSLCIWQATSGDAYLDFFVEPTYYFAARDRSLGSVKCVSSLGCNEKSRIYGDCLP